MNFIEMLKELNEEFEEVSISDITNRKFKINKLNTLVAIYPEHSCEEFPSPTVDEQLGKWHF
jgi:hypothetical protein